MEGVVKVPAFWENKRVLVTGATGMLGSSLVDALTASKAYVVSLVRNWNPQREAIRNGIITKTVVASGSLEDYRTVEKAIVENEVDTVFHLGAQSIVGTAFRSPFNTFETNIRGTYNVLEACRVHSELVKRVVIASSDKAYGENNNLPYTEEMALMGKHPYEVSKTCTDLLATSYYHSYGLPITVARCGNIYGAGDLNWSRIIPGTIRSLLLNQAPVLRSDGKYVRDYIYVRDAVSGYLELAEHMNRSEVCGQAFNFSPKLPTTVLEVVSKICEIMGKHSEPIILNAAKGEIRDQCLDSSKAKTLLEWYPRFSLEKGLQETIPWYREFIERGYH